MLRIPWQALILGICTVGAAGCAEGQPFCNVEGLWLARGVAAEPKIASAKPEGSGNGNSNEEKPHKPPKTLFNWAIGPDTPEQDEDEKEDVIVTDRPDFTEASSTVGRGRIQLEGGYTFTRTNQNLGRTYIHSFPETLLRFGLFADWLEGRVGWNYTDQTNRVNLTRTRFSGGEDLYLGAKIGLTEQKGFLPETGLIPQMLVPTGVSEITANTVLPGFNYVFSWEINKFLSLGGGFEMNRARDDLQHSYLETAPALTIGYKLTRKLDAYTEGFALFPSGSIDPQTGPEYYFDGGFSYKVTNNFQLDIRAGVGLNKHADDYFFGSGFAVRY